jgi:AraC family transcriptional regulator
MPEALMHRISVIRDEKVVPLLPDRPLSNSVVSSPSGLIVETHLLRATDIPKHEHSSLCLHLQTRSPVQMEWWSDGKHGEETHGPGSMLLAPPGTQDRLYWYKPSKRIVLSMDESYLLRAAQELGKKSRLTLESRWVFEDHQLGLLLSEFRREMESNWEMGILYGDHLGMSLAIALITKYSRDSAVPAIARGGISKVRLQRVLDYVEANIHLEIGLDDLAQIANMSRFHFLRLFRTATGVTPHRYLTDRRLQAAKTLLRLDSRNVSEIAFETGFQNARSFTRVFRRFVGVSPSEYKRQS